MFTAVLGLSGPWRVTRSEFDAEATQLDLYLDFDRGARFACPARDCARGCAPVHDTVDKTWRHLDFFQHMVLLRARGRGSGCCSKRWRAPSRRRCRWRKSPR
ncbi:MAG: hypothetical protein ACRDRS_05595 [Pseudonocardiaceae bacterium]